MTLRALGRPVTTASTLLLLAALLAAVSACGRRQAAETAPQRVWASTTIRGAPRTAEPYSAVPSVAVSARLPALRATNSSPSPRAPNTSSGGTRLSEHPMTVAQGA